MRYISLQFCDCGNMQEIMQYETSGQQSTEPKTCMTLLNFHQCISHRKCNLMWLRIIQKVDNHTTLYILN